MVGLFGATLVVSLIVAPQAYGHKIGNGTGLPGLSVLTAEVLMLASVLALILYVHQAGQSMRVGGLIDLVGDQTRDMVRSTYKSQIRRWRTSPVRISSRAGNPAWCTGSSTTG
jgi:uncharacterized membrane protein